MTPLSHHGEIGVFVQRTHRIYTVGESKHRVVPRDAPLSPERHAAGDRGVFFLDRLYGMA